MDVGHTAEAPGATSARGFKEYDFNLRLAKEIEQKLIEAGFGKTMLLVTEGRAMKGLVKRVTVANNADADLFLSIHHNSVPNHFLEKWEHEGQERSFSDRFKGHSIFISKNNAEFSGEPRLRQAARQPAQGARPAVHAALHRSDSCATGGVSWSMPPPASIATTS